MKSKLKLLLAALAIGSTVASAAVYALSDRAAIPLEKATYASDETSYSSSYFKLRYDYNDVSYRVGLGSNSYFENGINTDFTLIWDNSDSDSFYIKVDDNYINANQAQKQNEIQLVNLENAIKWTMENGAIKQGNKYLYFNASHPRVSAYTQKNDNGYPIAYFYTPAEYNNNLTHCNWSDFAKQCLTKIQYNNAIGSEPESESGPGQSSESNEETTESSEETELTTHHTVNFADGSYANAQEISEVKIGDYCRVVFNKGTNSNSPKYYTTGEAIRCYGGNYFTISSDNTITKIELIFASGEDNNAITVDVGSFANNIWTGRADSIKFTIGGTSGHRRIQSITATYIQLS